MSNWNFDKELDRHETNSLKYDGLKDLFGREDLIPLWVADMDFEVCENITKAIETRMNHHIFGYSCPRKEYWQSIIDWQREKHNFNFTQNEIRYVPGVVKGIALAINYFTQKGDKIVIQPPVYHPFKMVIEGNKRVVVDNPLLRHGDKFEMDLPGLEEIFKTQNPKLFILCNPHNPIGIAWSKDTLQKVALLAKKYNVIVISDEIHGDLAIFNNKNTPFATSCKEAEEVSITLGAPSKTFNIPGLVSSWVVIKNPELRTEFYEWLESNEFDCPTLIATVATEAAYYKCSDWVDAMKKYVEENIITIEEFCKERLPQIHPVRPEASFLVWLDCTKLNLSHDALIDLFINKAHLALNDGEMFGSAGAGHMRFNVATSRATITKALTQLEKAIKEL